ncbi:DUF4349 domain-containing protein [Treponema sp.]|uniref:DUF4349 domain-containing protein n=1 Tax=Treponema sp. TaxID=166 RepID=UPI00388E62F9
MDKNKFKRLFAIGFTAVSILAVIVANNRKENLYKAELMNYSAERPRLAMTKVSSKRASEPISNMAYSDAIIEEESFASPKMHEDSDSQDKKVIKTADVNLQVESLSGTLSSIEEWVRINDGYISFSNESSTNLNITAHIPASKFDAAMESCGTLGKIMNKSINAEDVTEQYYDLETRLENKRILVKKFQEYLKKATNVKEIMQVESQLASTTAELERMQAQMNRMSKEITYSRVHFYVQLPANRTENGIILPDTKSEFSEFISNLVNFALHYLWSILYIAICGTLLVILFIVVYWICFGRIGLIRKLFNKIK